MAILYVASEAYELKPFAAYLTGLRKLNWPVDYAFEGILKGRRILLAANGPGPKLAGRAVEIAIRAVSAADLSASRLEAVASVGLCGALDAALKSNEIIVANGILDSVQGKTYGCGAVLSESSFTEGLLLSQDRVAQGAADKQALRALGAIAVDMESAGVAARTERAGIPFCCIKVVSDTAQETFCLDLNQMRTTEGRFARGKIIVHAFTHPGILPGLFQLKQRASGAARALGDFLVSCRIQVESCVDVRSDERPVGPEHEGSGLPGTEPDLG